MHHLQRYVIPIFFIAVALIVFVRRKPLLLNYRWFLLFFAALFSLPMMDVFSEHFDLMTLFPLIVFLIIFGFMYYFMRGVMVLGADGDDFQRAFIATLTEGNYEFEQTFSSIKIKEPPLEISIAFQSLTGSGQIRLRSKENKETFNKIIDQLRMKEIKTNLIVPSLYLVLGIVILVMDFMMW